MFEPYDSPAGGWGALLRRRASASRAEHRRSRAPKALLAMNQPERLRLPGMRLARSEAHQLVSSSARTAPKPSPSSSRSEVCTPEFFARTCRERIRNDTATTGSRSKDASPSRCATTASTRSLRARSWDDAFATDRHACFAHSRARMKRTSIRPAAPPTKPRSSIRYSCDASAPTTSPIAPTCATRRPASACPRASASAKAPCLLEDFDTTDAIFVARTESRHE